MEPGAPAEIKIQKKKGRRLAFYLSVVVPVIGLLAAIAIPNFVKARTTSCKNACINNLRQIDGAKEQWALENKASAGTQLTAADEEAVDKFIKGGRPKCPSGDASAHYIYNAIDAAPSCTVNASVSAGHSL